MAGERVRGGVAKVDSSSGRALEGGELHREGILDICRAFPSSLHLCVENCVHAGEEP